MNLVTSVPYRSYTYYSIYDDCLWGGGGGEGERGEGGGAGGETREEGHKDKNYTTARNEISNFLDICVEFDSVLHGLLDSREPEN